MLFDEPGPSTLPRQRKVEAPTAYSRFKRNEWLDGLLRKLQDARDPAPSPPPSPTTDRGEADDGSISVSVAKPVDDRQSDEEGVDQSEADLRRPEDQYDEIVLDMSSDLDDEESQEFISGQPEESFDRTQNGISRGQDLVDELDPLEESMEYTKDGAPPSNGLKGGAHFTVPIYPRLPRIPFVQPSHVMPSAQSAASSTASQHPRALPFEEQVIDPELLSAVVEAVTAGQQNLADAAGAVTDTDVDAGFPETDGPYTDRSVNPGISGDGAENQETEGPEQEDYDSYDEDHEEAESGEEDTGHRALDSQTYHRVPLQSHSATMNNVIEILSSDEEHERAQGDLLDELVDEDDNPTDEGSYSEDGQGSDQVEEAGPVAGSDQIAGSEEEEEEEEDEDEDEDEDEEEEQEQVEGVYDTDSEEEVRSEHGDEEEDEEEEEEEEEDEQAGIHRWQSRVPVGARPNVELSDVFLPTSSSSVHGRTGGTSEFEADDEADLEETTPPPIDAARRQYPVRTPSVELVPSETLALLFEEAPRPPLVDLPQAINQDTAVLALQAQLPLTPTDIDVGGVDMFSDIPGGLMSGYAAEPPVDTQVALELQDVQDYLSTATVDLLLPDPSVTTSPVLIDTEAMGVSYSANSENGEEAQEATESALPDTSQGMGPDVPLASFDNQETVQQTTHIELEDHDIRQFMEIPSDTEDFTTMSPDPFTYLSQDEIVHLEAVERPFVAVLDALERPYVMLSSMEEGILLEDELMEPEGVHTEITDLSPAVLGAVTQDGPLFPEAIVATARPEDETQEETLPTDSVEKANSRDSDSRAPVSPAPSAVASEAETVTRPGERLPSPKLTVEETFPADMAIEVNVISPMEDRSISTATEETIAGSSTEAIATAVDQVSIDALAVAALPDPAQPPPDNLMPLPLILHEPFIQSSPSMIVEPPFEPPKPSSIQLDDAAIRREDTPPILPDPQKAPPNARVSPPLSPGEHYPIETSRSLIVEPPADEAVPDGLVADPTQPEAIPQSSDALVGPAGAPHPIASPLPLDEIHDILPNRTGPAVVPPETPPISDARSPSRTVTPRSETPTIMPNTVAAPADSPMDMPEVPYQTSPPSPLANPIATQRRDVADELMQDDVSSIPARTQEQSSSQTPIPTTGPHIFTEDMDDILADSAPLRLRHHHGRDNSEGPLPPRRRTPRQSRQSMPPGPLTPVTRSHCFYRKYRISDGDLWAVILVPQCVAGDHEQFDAETSDVIGQPTFAEEQKARTNAITESHPLLQPSLAQKAHRLVGHALLSEGHCYLLEAKEDALIPIPDGLDDGQHLTPGQSRRQSKRKAELEADVIGESSRSWSAKARTNLAAGTRSSKIPTGSVTGTPARVTRARLRQQAQTPADENEDEAGTDQDYTPTKLVSRRNARSLSAIRSTTPSRTGPSARAPSEPMVASTPSQRRLPRRSAARDLDEAPYRPDENDEAQGDVIEVASATPGRGTTDSQRRQSRRSGVKAYSPSPQVDDGGVTERNVMSTPELPDQTEQLTPDPSLWKRLTRQSAANDRKEAAFLPDKAETQGPTEVTPPSVIGQPEGTPTAIGTRKRKSRASDDIGGLAGIPNDEQQSTRPVASPSQRATRSMKRRAVASPSDPDIPRPTAAEDERVETKSQGPTEASEGDEIDVQIEMTSSSTSTPGRRMKKWAKNFLSLRKS